MPPFETVLADLAARRDSLTDQIGEIDRLEASLRHFYHREAPVESVVTEQAPELEPLPKEPRKLADIVTDLIEQGRYTQSEIVERALCERPGTPAGSANSAVYALMKSGKAHKGEDLILRPVVKGSVTGLPAPTKAPIARGRYQQYEAPTVLT